MNWIRHPNFPEAKVKCVFIGHKYSFLDTIFSNLDISVIHVPDNADVLPGLAGHTDLSVFHKGGNGLIISRSIENFASELSKLGFDIDITENKCSNTYPNDVGLNAFILKNKLFHIKKYSDKKLLSFAAENNIEVINVNQGYAKCSVCVVDERHIITEDKSINKAAEACGIDCLLISPGYIKLEGFEHGFIGGASGKVSDRHLAFTGTLMHHPDEHKILEFIKKCGVEPLYLTDEQCFDVGSIIPVIEE